MNIDNQYKLLCEKILKEGYTYEMKNRSGTSVTQLDTYSFTHNMEDGFPLLSLKKVSFHNIQTELNWFLSGDDRIGFLKSNGVRIWNKDVENFVQRKEYNDHNYAGRVYGVQWRDFGHIPPRHSVLVTELGRSGFDQIENLVEKLREGNVSRRGIVTAWNPIDVAEDSMCLPPCHWAFEVIENPYNDSFSLKWHQRSVDTFLGWSYNVASYALLGKWLELRTGKKFTHLHADLSCVHIYHQHLDQVKEVLSRDSKHDLQNKVSVSLNRMENTHCVWWDLNNYKSHPAVKADMIAEDKSKRNDHRTISKKIGRKRPRRSNN